jgi:hypothetical protein
MSDRLLLRRGNATTPRHSSRSKCPTPNNLGDVPDATNAQSLADDLGAIARSAVPEAIALVGSGVRSAIACLGDAAAGHRSYALKF